MLKIGITGGIGSGKTTVCKLFEVLGVPVFYADDEARALMHSSAEIVAGISRAFGEGMYRDGRLDPAALSAAVFSKPEKIAVLNAIVHPVVIAHAEAWMARQQAPYALKEAALFFESGSHLGTDKMIGVSAPEELRIARAMRRSGLSREQALARIAAQMDENEKMARCDFIIVNDDVAAVIPQVLRLHETLRAEAAKPSSTPNKD
jgi:dephospho-CoA kinase